MNRKLLKDKFGNIPQSVYNKMGSKERQPIKLYNEYMRSIEGWYIDIEDLKDDIKEIEKKIESYSNRCKKIYEKNKHLEEDYSMNMNVSVNRKNLKNGDTVNYWMINLKYKGLNKPIYLGSEDKVKEVVMRELKLKKQPNEEELRERLGFLCYDNLEELVMTEKNLFHFLQNRFLSLRSQ